METLRWRKSAKKQPSTTREVPQRCQLRTAPCRWTTARCKQQRRLHGGAPRKRGVANTDDNNTSTRSNKTKHINIAKQHQTNNATYSNKKPIQSQRATPQAHTAAKRSQRQAWPKTRLHKTTEQQQEEEQRSETQDGPRRKAKPSKYRAKHKPTNDGGNKKRSNVRKRRTAKKGTPSEATTGQN